MSNGFLVVDGEYNHDENALLDFEKLQVHTIWIYKMLNSIMAANSNVYISYSKGGIIS